MAKEHYSCHLCKDSDPHVYYRNYEELAGHFDASHFRCHEESCKADLFVVFETEAALDYHIERVHRKATIRKGGKNVYDATGLLNFQYEDEDGENQPQEEFLDFAAMGITLEDVRNSGMEVTPEVIAMFRFSEEQKKKQMSQKQKKKSKIASNDHFGRDFSEIVSPFNGSSKELMAI